MSRFGSTATITWGAGNNAGTFAGGTVISLDQGDMPQFPVEEWRITDEVEYRTKYGKVWNYKNYTKIGITLNWSNLNETTRNELATMVRAIPYFSISSGGGVIGTFQLVPDSITDTESSYQLYDFSFDAEEM